MSWIAEPWKYEFFSRAMIAGTMVGALCAVVGVFVVLRRNAYVGQGLGYGLLGGVALAALAGINTYIGAIMATLLGAAVIEALRRVRGITPDAAIALVSTTLFSVGVIVVSSNRRLDINTESLLFGNLLGVTMSDIATLVGVSILASIALSVIYKTLLFSTVDAYVARLQGVNTAAVDVVYSMVIGAVVIVALQIVGVLLITAALVLPATAARLLFRSIGPILLGAACIGVVSTVVGLYWSYHRDLSSGPAVTLVAAAALGCAGLVGAVRRRV